MLLWDISFFASFSACTISHWVMQHSSSNITTMLREKYNRIERTVQQKIRKNSPVASSRDRDTWWERCHHRVPGPNTGCLSGCSSTGKGGTGKIREHEMEGWWTRVCKGGAHVQRERLTGAVTVVTEQVRSNGKNMHFLLCSLHDWIWL